MSSFRIIIGVCLILLSSGYFIFNYNLKSDLKSASEIGLSAVNYVQAENDNKIKKIKNISNIIVEDIILGDLNAPVTIIEYASFTCPHCKNFHEGVFKKLKKNYIEKGKVKFILRDVYFDRYGLWAAMVARCGRSEIFYDIVAEIFRKQSEWTKGEADIEIVDNLKKIGLSLGMDGDIINSCLSDGDMAQALVDAYQANAQRDSISSTPSFLINGEKIRKPNYAEFVDKIEEYLKGY